MQKVYIVLKHYKGLGITASSKKKKKNLFIPLLSGILKLLLSSLPPVSTIHESHILPQGLE